MGKSKQHGNFDSQAERGMHRSEDDPGYMDPKLSGDMIPEAGIMSGEPTNANTATMQARKLQQEQTTLQDKRANQSDR